MGKYYLVSVDRYSNWPIVERAKDGSTLLGLSTAYVVSLLPMVSLKNSHPTMALNTLPDPQNLS